MNKISLDVETRVQESKCCECGYLMDAVSGPCKPVSGDLTLCIECGSLNAFTDNLMLRKPTEDEYLEVAADSDFQKARQAILTLRRKS